MYALVPTAPWSDVFPREAESFVTAAERDTLFRGKRGIEETIDYELSVAFYESHFKPEAKGDGGASLGLFQIAPGTAQPYVGWVRAKRAARGDVFDPWATVRDELFDVEASPGLALRLMRVSFEICRDRPREERLGWYAAGGSGCRGIKESRHRVAKAEWIARAFPAPTGG
jgi:hypothetical protein